LALGALSFGFTPAAMAISSYDASASFSLTLNDVTDASGVQVTTGWSVDAFGSGVLDFLDSGVASATGTISVVDPLVFLSIGTGITQSSTASGTATNGFAWTDALTDLAINVDNTSGQDLTFNFGFDIIALASASGDLASANATVDFLDTLGAVNILAIASAGVGVPLPAGATGNASQSGFIEFTLGAGGVNSMSISGFVDSIGSAEAVPVPAAVWLFGSGLLGLVGVARRKRA
ncbi:MAG: VPLPA-CTERM sorting domain-containing protein, partial [Gammaproteobacteria bacterium]|nr:VPLPA-CTERM sorting domain-containing protein [Gammaproteobacteria bacterium]